MLSKIRGKKRCLLVATLGWLRKPLPVVSSVKVAAVFFDQSCIAGGQLTICLPADLRQSKPFCAALGLEFIEGYFYKLYGIDHIINQMLYCIEELFEMWGIILFIYALLDYIAFLNLRLSFKTNN